MKYLKAIFLSCFIFITSCVPIFADTATSGSNFPDGWATLTQAQTVTLNGLKPSSYDNLLIYQDSSGSLYFVPFDDSAVFYQDGSFDTVSTVTYSIIATDGTIPITGSLRFGRDLSNTNEPVVYLTYKGINYVNNGIFPLNYTNLITTSDIQNNVIGAYSVVTSSNSVQLVGLSGNSVGSSGSYHVPTEFNCSGSPVMTCSYSESYYVSNTESVNLSGYFPVTSINSNVVTVYDNTVTFTFNDYYTGSILLSNQYYWYTTDGSLTGATLTFTDQKQITLHRYSLGSDGSITSPGLLGWNMYRSRPFDSYFNNIVSAIESAVGQTNDLIENGTSESQQANQDFQNQNNDLNNDVNDYNHFQDDQVQNMETAMQQVQTTPDLFTFEGFANSASWLSSQLVNIYNTHASIQVMTGFGLIVGLALMIIGRRWR